MGNFFPRWTNFLPIQVIICLGITGIPLIAWIWYTWTPKHTRVGYQPQQPIPFDHSIHAGQLGMDCRYCHNHVESSSHSNVPAAQVCWNCHGPGKVKSNSPKLALLRAAMDPSDENYTGEPIRWVQVHQTPDYAYFNHSVHVNRGVSCVECHGKVNEMEVVHHEKSLSMGFCLDCHRNVESHLRPLDEITNLDWTSHDIDPDEFYAYLAEKTGESAEEMMKEDGVPVPEKPEEGEGAVAAADLLDDDEEESEPVKLDPELVGARLKQAWDIRPPQDCSACHR